MKKKCCKNCRYCIRQTAYYCERYALFLLDDEELRTAYCSNYKATKAKVKKA